MDNTEAFLQELTEKVVSLFGFTKESFSISKGEEDNFNVTIQESEDSGFLIGYHGKTLEAIQFILTLILFYKNDKWQRVSLEVGDYKKKKIVYLESLAEKAIEKAKFLKEKVSLSPMTPAERRIVHLYLKSRDDISSSSEGEGLDRHIVISPKKENEELLSEETIVSN